MDLQAVARLFRRRWWIVAATFLAGVVAAVMVSTSTVKTYRATASLYVSIPAASSVQEAVQGVQLSTQLLASYTKVLTLDATVDLVSESLDHRVTPAQVRAKVSADVVPETVLINVHAVDTSPTAASELANSAATALTEVIADLETTPAGGVKARVVNRAQTPTSPESPRPKRNVAVGGFFGLVVGAVVALGIETFDRTIRTPSQVTEVFSAPLLGSIPRRRGLSEHPLVAVREAGSPIDEAYRALRTAVRLRNQAVPLKTILITSPAPRDGKTTVAANLALTISQDGARVILIDADLRRTRLTGVFGVDATGPGLTGILLGRASLAEALRPWSGTLSLVPSGAQTLVYPSEALGSDAMKSLLTEARALADVVIIDAPPVLAVTDPVILASLVDGTIIVCRWGRTSEHAAQAARLTLEGTTGGADVVGVVLNAERGGHSAGYYSYSTKSARFPQHFAGRDGKDSESVRASERT